MKAGRFRFGVFEFDAEKLELRRQGALVHLQSQPARLLVCLIQSSDRTVTREELRAAIWGNETFVDFERGLNFCISQIRSALGDDPSRPVYLQTFPKRGYQFIAPVEFIPLEPEAPETVSQEKHAVVSRGPVASRRALSIVGAAIVVLSAAGFALAHYMHRVTAWNRPPILAVVRFDNETGNPDVTRFSDGLTDNVVERLSAVSNGRFSVIGNAGILRLPREQRDLIAIGKSLGAKYVVLGQVQVNGDKTRILVHLIRLPDQIHLKVVRMEDRTLAELLSTETEVAQRIADTFSTRIAADSSVASSPALITY